MTTKLTAHFALEELACTQHREIDKLNGAAVIAGGSMKELAKQGSDAYIAATPNATQEPLPAAALIEFLAGAKAKDVFKAKGLQPG